MKKDALPDRWYNQYKPISSIDCQIYEHLMVSPTIDEWIQTINSMPNDKAMGPSKISFEMLKHVGPECQKFLTELFSLCLIHNSIPTRDGQSVLRSLIGPDRSLGNFRKSNKAVLPIFCGTTELVKGRKVVNFGLDLITQLELGRFLFYQNQYFLLFSVFCQFRLCWS